jgi:hypothetical protein
MDIFNFIGLFDCKNKYFFYNQWFYYTSQGTLNIVFPYLFAFTYTVHLQAEH